MSALRSARLSFDRHFMHLAALALHKATVIQYEFRLADARQSPGHQLFGTITPPLRITDHSHMKTIAITVDEDTLARVDRLAQGSRSRLIRGAAREYVCRLERQNGRRGIGDHPSTQGPPRPSGRGARPRAGEAMKWGDDGLPRESAIHCDFLALLFKRRLTGFVGALSAGKQGELRRALAHALQLTD